MLKLIILIVVVVIVYRLIEKYGWAPARDCVVDWLRQHFAWIDRIATFIKR
jgi:hypothetical protein